MLVQTEGVTGGATGARFGTWVAYQGDGRVALAVVLLLVACLVLGLASRIPRPLRFPRARSGWVIAALVGCWLVALIAFVGGFIVYARQELHDYPHGTAPPTPILPVTLVAAAVTAILIGVRTTGTPRGRFANAVIGAAVAPMLFELPFDVIVLSRTYPAVVPHPALYRLAFFGPLFLVELTTIALLCVAPGPLLSRVAVQTFGVMLIVFAGWAVAGFAFPSTPVSFTFNASSKLLAFLAMLGLFFPHWFPNAIGKIRRRGRSGSTGATVAHGCAGSRRLMS